MYLQYLEYLRREECTDVEKEQCRFEPREVILQKCDPTVKEVCQDKMKPVYTEKCENIKICILQEYLSTNTQYD